MTEKLNLISEGKAKSLYETSEESELSLFPHPNIVIMLKDVTSINVLIFIIIISLK